MSALGIVFGVSPAAIQQALSTAVCWIILIWGLSWLFPERQGSAIRSAIATGIRGFVRLIRLALRTFWAVTGPARKAVARSASSRSNSRSG